MFRIIRYILPILLLPFLLDAQEIKFRNSSFEGSPGYSRMPRKWVDCGFQEESPPDLHPEPRNIFNVDLGPYDGRTFLGLVTRDNNTWEAIGGLLNYQLEAGQCYRFQIALASAPEFVSASRATGLPKIYNAPVRLKIWGGNDYCELQELLATSPPVRNGEWEVYTFLIQPRMGNYSVITFSAEYPEDAVSATNGNLLLDAASAFEPMVDCNVSGNSISDLEAAASAAPIVLKLPTAEYFSEEENRLSFLANTLRDFWFLEDYTLADKRFLLDGETEVRNGSPQLYALQHALQFTEGAKWELVVYDQDEVARELKVLNLGLMMPSGLPTSLSIQTYDAERYDGTRWQSMSIQNGLYLRQVEE
ncbi:MAG: hypothetical protein AAFP77_23190 [Bacteroidota bacterium]